MQTFTHNTVLYCSGVCNFNKAKNGSKFTYHGDRVSACGGCEAAVTARTRCGWVKLRECSEMLYGRFPLKLKGAVYNSHVRLTILYLSEAWSLKEYEKGVL